MSKQLERIIELLGRTPNEAKVYLATLELGEAHVSDIAAKAKLPRTTTQSILEALAKAGFMTFYVQRRYKYWVAEDPERLLKDLQRREEAMQEALPQLSAMRKARWGRARGKEKDALGALRIMADASPQPILIADDGVAIVYANPAWEAQFGYSLAEIAGKNPRVLQSGKTPPRVYERMWKALRAGSMFQTDEIIDARKDGSLFNLLSTIFLLSHEGRTYYVQVLDDITERKRVEELQKRFLRASGGSS